MPLYKEWTTPNDSLAAIWKIEEPEAFFTERTGITSDIKSEKRRLEFLAGRFLLKHLEEDFPLFHIHKDEHDKPRLHDNAYYFSISHSWPYVAVEISDEEECGIDIQTFRPRMLELQHKFLSEDEQGYFNNDEQLLALAWCAKEAAYKWQGKRGVEFIDHLPITYSQKIKSVYNMTIYLKLTDPPKMLAIEGIINEEFACAYVTDAQHWVIY